MKRLLWTGIILVAVWATVFCVPSLNFLFRAQWQGSGLMPFAVWPGDGNTLDIPETRLQRFPGDKNVLLFTALQSPRRPEYDYGRTPRFLPSPLFPGSPASSEPLEKLRRLEQLINRYPDDATLVAVYLRAALESPLGRRPEELDPVDPREPPPELDRDIPQPLLDAAGLRKALQICERGRQLEPNNAFFDWMKCGLLLLSWRDGEALQVLEKAMHRSTYDDHVLEQIQRMVQARSVVLGRNLTIEEKQTLLSIWQPRHLSGEMNLARLIGVHITKAQRRGAHQVALRITANLASMGAKRRAAPQLGNGLDTFLENSAYYAPIRDEFRLWRENNNSGGVEKRDNLFLEYARRHGRDDQATLALQFFKQTEAQRKQINDLYPYEQLGTSYWSWAATEGLRKIGVLLLLFLPVPLLMVGLMCLPAVRKLLQSESPVVGAEPGFAEVLRGTVECGCWAVFCVFLYPPLVLSYWGDDFMTAQSYQRKAYWQFLMLDNGELATLFLFALPLLFGAIYALRSGVRWQKRRQGEVVKHLFWRNLAWFVLTLGLAFLCWFALQINWEYLLSQWSMFLESWEISSLRQEWGMLFVLLCGVVAIFLIQYFQWRKRPHRREAVRYSLHLFYRSMAAWLVVGSVLYLCTLIVALPLRNRAEAKVERVLAVGEVQARQEWNK